MAAQLNTLVVPFDRIEKIVECARRLLYIRALQNAPFDEDFLPLSYLVEHHSRGSYDSMISVWTTGLESMRGKTLIQRCTEIATKEASKHVDSLKV